MSEQSITRHRPSGSRSGSTYRPRLRDEERVALRAALATKYEKGASIRELLAEHGTSYGLTRNLLVEAGVELRGRSGRRKARS